MVIDRAAAGQGVGTKLVDHAVRIARRDGRTRLVLDAWTSNKGLHRTEPVRDLRPRRGHRRRVTRIGQPPHHEPPQLPIHRPHISRDTAAATAALIAVILPPG